MSRRMQFFLLGFTGCVALNAAIVPSDWPLVLAVSLVAAGVAAAVAGEG